MIDGWLQQYVMQNETNNKLELEESLMRLQMGNRKTMQENPLLKSAGVSLPAEEILLHKLVLIHAKHQACLQTYFLLNVLVLVIHLLFAYTLPPQTLSSIFVLLFAQLLSVYLLFNTHSAFGDPAKILIPVNIAFLLQLDFHPVNFHFMLVLTINALIVITFNLSIASTIKTFFTVLYTLIFLSNVIILRIGLFQYQKILLEIKQKMYKEQFFFVEAHHINQNEEEDFIGSPRKPQQKYNKKALSEHFIEGYLSSYPFFDSSLQKYSVLLAKNSYEHQNVKLKSYDHQNSEFYSN